MPISGVRKRLLQTIGEPVGHEIAEHQDADGRRSAPAVSPPARSPARPRSAPAGDVRLRARRPKKRWSNGRSSVPRPAKQNRSPRRRGLRRKRSWRCGFFEARSVLQFRRRPAAKILAAQGAASVMDSKRTWQSEDARRNSGSGIASIAPQFRKHRRGREPVRTRPARAWKSRIAAPACAARNYRPARRWRSPGKPAIAAFPCVRRGSGPVHVVARARWGSPPRRRCDRCPMASA